MTKRTQWAYYTEYCQTGTPDMAALGRRGWELVAVAPIVSTFKASAAIGTQFAFFFKRPMTKEEVAAAEEAQNVASNSAYEAPNSQSELEARMAAIDAAARAQHERRNS